MEPLLTIDNFSLTFPPGDRESEPVRALCGVDLRVEAGRTHALVGESSSGKSVTAFSVLRLLEDTTRVETSGSIRFDGQELTTLSRDRIRAIRGNRIAMIFQEPMTSLNPVYLIGTQLMEPLLLHQRVDKKRPGPAPSSCWNAPASTTRNTASPATRTSSPAASASG